MLALTLPKDLDTRLEDAHRDNGMVESWLQTDGIAAYNRLKADPGRALGTQQVRAQLKARREGQ